MDNKAYRQYLQVPFLLCVLTLATAVIAMPAMIESLGMYFIKLALPLQNSLDEIDKSRLAPYQVVYESKIKNKEIEEALGTTDYIQWELFDPNEPITSSTRYCSLFITYYTGKPDQVPHVPEECYTGGGNQRLGTDDIEIDIKSIDQTIPIRTLRFGSGKANFMSSGTFNVFYFFKVNGKYAGNRDACRGVMQANLFSKYSYFSKVEWKFYNKTPSGMAIYPKMNEARQASEKLLNVLMPVLEQNHWPDWEKANQEPKTEQE